MGKELSELGCIVATKLGGPEGKATAAAIEALVLSTVEAAALKATPDFLDPIVSRIFDIIEPMIRAEVEKGLDKLKAAACAVPAPVSGQ